MMATAAGSNAPERIIGMPITKKTITNESSVSNHQFSPETSKVGYNTVHVGKWHQGDIEEALPHNQGFDFAAFPMHNQATFNLMTAAAEEQRWANGVSREAERAEMAYTLDPGFRPRGWVLGLEARKGGKAREWGLKPGDEDYNYGYEYYRKLNQHFHTRACFQRTDFRLIVHRTGLKSLQVLRCS